MFGSSTPLSAPSSSTAARSSSPWSFAVNRPTIRLVVVSGAEFRQRRARPRLQQPRLRVDPDLVARVRDVQVPHRQLSNAVLRRELALALFHRQSLGPVGEV